MIESRLLTPEEIDNNWPPETPKYDTIKETLEKGILIGAKAIAKAQDTKTASILIAEIESIVESIREIGGEEYLLIPVTKLQSLKEKALG